MRQSLLGMNERMVWDHKSGHFLCKVGCNVVCGWEIQQRPFHNINARQELATQVSRSLYH